jgi:AraC family transcriptional regulator, transcriptional activator of pobA
MTESKLPVFYIKDFEKPSGSEVPFYINELNLHLRQNTFLTWPYRHDFFIIIYFTKGSGSIHIDFTGYPVEEGSLFFMSPGQVHDYKLKKGSEGQIIFFGIDLLEGYFSYKKISRFSIFDKRLLALKIDPGSRYEKTIRFLIARLHDEVNLLKTGSVDLVKDYLDILIIELLRISGNSSSAPGTIHWQLQELEKLIDEHFSEHRPPAFYADKLHITTKYLNQLCKKFFVKTTTQLIHERVALEAKRLLTHERLNSNQVANRLNFDDQSYFTRFFRKSTGMTPGEFKKRFGE